MSELSGPNYNLVYPQLVIVTASAYNSYGWGMASPVNTVGATIKTVPTQMSQPARGPLTTIN